MCKMLLSINPEHVDNIIHGTKKYEFRKSRCKENVDTIVIYATSPMKCVVGEVEVKEVLEKSILDMWNETKELAGVSYRFFRSYYKGKRTAIAYSLGDIVLYDEPRTLADFGLRCAPQSFAYV